MRAKIIAPSFIAAVLVVCSAAAFGQPKKNPKKTKVYNALVHVTTQKSKVVGILNEVSDSAIYLLVEDGKARINVRINARIIKQIVIKRKGSVGRSILSGALIGMATGVFAGLAMGDSECDPNEPYCSTAELKSVQGAVLMCGVGVLVGWIVGSIPKKNIIIGESQSTFEKNVQLLSKYSLSDAGH